MGTAHGMTADKSAVALRKQEEIDFHNRLAIDYLSGGLGHRFPSLKYYDVAKRSVGFFRSWLAQHCAGKAVLDYGCGDGGYAFLAAKHGARSVLGVDISDVAILRCLKQRDARGLTRQCAFAVMDCENLGCADNTFDIVCEAGVLHHVELEKAARELARVVKPEGVVICYEALGHNPLFQLYRRLTPQLRTRYEVEHIFRVENFALLQHHFAQIDTRFFHLTVLLSTGLLKFSWGQRWYHVLDALDERLLKIPLLRRQAWVTVFVLSRPKKSAQE
jgi:ubiquinone/menaquinone biosynthesis C-methylase UbiE